MVIESKVESLIQIRPNVGVQAEFLVIKPNDSLVVDESVAGIYSTAISTLVAGKLISFGEVKDRKPDAQKSQESLAPKKEKTDEEKQLIKETKELIAQKTEAFSKATTKEQKLVLKEEIAELKKKINALK